MRRLAAYRRKRIIRQAVKCAMAGELVDWRKVAERLHTLARS
jgi:hypothetical protein